VDLQFIRAVTALIRGEVDIARQIIHEAELHIAPPHQLSRFGYYLLGLRMLFESHATCESLSTEAVEFLRLFAERQRFGDQDVPAYAASRILRSAGRAQEAAALLNDYCSVCRRERYPLPNYLALEAGLTGQPF
jgi:hypothetical protein